PTPFTIGRGMFNNGVTDWSDAIIDEVRISDAALSPAEFLFETVPAVDNPDFDDDGDVDGFDFLTWQRGAGDANNDGMVDAADFALWEAQFGTLGGVATAVPEPAGTWFAVGFIPWLTRRRRCR
ncbi:MAG: hypothetical protein KDA61_21995, partial [Planctomycetales bacterium]|nr:hypothetical protein [Planctomycetales bacterium]